MHYHRGGEIAQWLASLSVMPAVQVRAQHDLLVSERWNLIRVLLTNADDWFNKGRPCVIMYM